MSSGSAGLHRVLRCCPSNGDISYRSVDRELHCIQPNNGAEGGRREAKWSECFTVNGEAGFQIHALQADTYFEISASSAPPIILTFTLLCNQYSAASWCKDQTVRGRLVTPRYEPIHRKRTTSSSVFLVLLLLLLLLQLFVFRLHTLNHLLLRPFIPLHNSCSLPHYHPSPFFLPILALLFILCRRHHFLLLISSSFSSSSYLQLCSSSSSEKDFSDHH